MAAAEGTVDVGLERAAGLLGLVSWLFWRDLKAPALPCACVCAAGRGASCLAEGRTGDVVRELCGLLPAEESCGCRVVRMADDCLRRAGMEADEEFLMVMGLTSLLDDAVLAVEAGSAVSEFPLMERKSSLFCAAMAWEPGCERENEQAKAR